MSVLVAASRSVPGRSRPVSTAAAALAYAAVAAALSFRDGHLEWGGMLLITGAVALLVLSYAVRWPDALGDRAARAIPTILGVTVATFLATLVVRDPARNLSPGTTLGLYRFEMLLTCALAATYLWRDFPLPRLRWAALVAAYVLVGAGVVLASPRPFIDVWYVQQRAADLLVHGQNPYAAWYDNIYGHLRFIGAKQVVNGKVRSITYPPLSLLMAVPGWLAGDVRWALLAAVAGAASCAVAAGRRLGLKPGHPYELAAVAMLFHPRAFLLIEQAWTEPFIALGACAFAWALAAKARRGRWLALALTLSTKQFGVVWLPVLAATRQLGWRTLLYAAGACLLVAAPFFAWDPAAFLRGNVLYQFELPFRPDSLSLPAAVAAMTAGFEPKGQFGFFVAGVVTYLVARRGERTIAGAFRGGATVYLALFAFSDRAFFNYYWFASILLLMSVIASLEPGPEVAPPSAVEQREAA